MKFTQVLATSVLLMGSALALPLTETDVSLAVEKRDVLPAKRAANGDLFDMFKGDKGCHDWDSKKCKDDGKYKHVRIDTFNLPCTGSTLRLSGLKIKYSLHPF